MSNKNCDKKIKLNYKRYLIRFMRFYWFIQIDYESEESEDLRLLFEDDITELDYDEI